METVKTKQAVGKWYVVRVEPRADYQAAWELHRAGYQIVSPRVSVVHPKKTRADEPMFPGYLFLRCNLDGGERPSFREAPHVSGWVNFDGVIPSVPDEAVDDLARRVEAINNQGGLWRRFKPGDKVLVKSNNLESLAEVVDEAKSPESRVRVLLQFMDRLVSAQVPWQDLQPAQEDSSRKSQAARRTRGRGRWIAGFGPRAAVPV